MTADQPTTGDVIVLGPRQPDESRRDYVRRIANAAPPPSPKLAAHLARLLPLPKAGGGGRG